MRQAIVGNLADAFTMAEEVIAAYSLKRGDEGKPWVTPRFEDVTRVAAMVVTYTAAMAEVARGERPVREPAEIQRVFDDALGKFCDLTLSEGVATSDVGRVVRLMVGTEDGKRMIRAMAESIEIRP